MLYKIRKILDEINGCWNKTFKSIPRKMKVTDKQF